jgi:hypothetical protein
MDHPDVPFLNNAFMHLPGGGYRVSMRGEPADAMEECQREMYVMLFGDVLREYQNGPGLDQELARRSSLRLQNNTQQFHAVIDEVLGQLGIHQAIPIRLHQISRQLRSLPLEDHTSLQDIQSKLSLDWLQQITQTVWVELKKRGYTEDDITA